MDSWAIKAIEREAMARAHREIATMPTTFTFMGVSEAQLTWLIYDYMARTGENPRNIDAKGAKAST